MIEKIAYVSTSIFTKKSRLLGFILTAFALSLGAPFWFGVLNQLVSIRGTGVKPEESKNTTKDSPIVDPVTAADTETNTIAAVETTSADNTELALDNFTAKLKNEPGIVGIGLQKENDTPSAFIMVMVETVDVKNYLIKKYGEVETLDHDQLLLNDFSIPVKYEIQNANDIHTGMLGAEIANITTALGFGTLGCFLKKTGSDKNYILSCWHVMKDNNEWSTPILVENKAIIDNANKSIALVEQGCLADTIDVGIAVCNDKIVTINNDLVIKSQHREVRPFDALVNTDVQLFGKVCKLQTAKIFHYKININLRYPGGKMHFMKDVFSITKNMQSPTSGGDSGAVVVDMNGTPLGMIIGGNDTFSYAVKFTNMFNKNMLYSEFSFLI